MSEAEQAPTVRYCGRDFSADELNEIRVLLKRHPEYNRAELSRQVCDLLNWRRPDGRRKDMSCRVAMLRLERAGLLTLPPPTSGNGNNGNGRLRPRLTAASEPREPVALPAGALGVLQFRIVEARTARRLPRLDSRPTPAKPPPRRQQRPLPDPPVDHLPQPRLPCPQRPRQATPRRLGTTLRLPPPAARDLRPTGPLPGHRLPRRQLAPRRANPGPRQARHQAPPRPPRQGRLPLSPPQTQTLPATPLPLKPPPLETPAPCGGRVH